MRAQWGPSVILADPFSRKGDQKDIWTSLYSHSEATQESAEYEHSIEKMKKKKAI